MTTMRLSFPSKLRQAADGAWFIQVCKRRVNIDLEPGECFLVIADAYHSETAVYVFEDIKELFMEWARIRLENNGECIFFDGDDIHVMSEVESPLASCLSVREIFDEDEFFDWMFREYNFGDQRVVRRMTENAISYARDLEATMPGSGYEFLGHMLENVLDDPKTEAGLLRLA